MHRFDPALEDREFRVGGDAPLEFRRLEGRRFT
jgi:hypothetical protein